MENSNNNKRTKEMNEVAEMTGNWSRWQPTKEQIEILESVYGACVKTPSAEQIQQITARLSVYGNIEGKNVFYWFQNTKARRRQKLKQDRLALLIRFYPAPPPPPQAYFPPIIPNVSESGFYYYHYDQIQAGIMMEVPLMEKRSWIPREPRNSKRNEECKTTLELFPLRPGGDSSGSNSSNSSDQTNDEDSACKDGERLIDFLSGNSSSATETNE